MTGLGGFNIATQRQKPPPIHSDKPVWVNGCIAAQAVFQRRSPISRSACLQPRIDQNDLRGLSEFLYLYKYPMKLRKTKATSHSWEPFHGQFIPQHPDYFAESAVYITLGVIGDQVASSPAEEAM